MRLHYYTLRRLAPALLLIIVAWGGLFYFLIKRQIEKSVDRNLNNYKLDFIQAIRQDSLLLTQHSFSSHIYHITPITEKEALNVKDIYADDILYQDGKALSARTLGTALALYGRYYRLQVTASTVEERVLIKNVMYSLIVLYGALLLSILFVHHFLLRTVWRPFYALITGMERFRIGHGEAMTDVSTAISEFALLNDAMKELVARAEHAYAQQQQFTGNASHELQTPIAICLNRLELLLEQDDINPATAQVIVSVMESLSRLSRLNKTLLLLTKIENDQFPLSSMVNVNNLVQDILVELKDWMHHKQINIELIRDKGPLIFCMNEALAGIMITNLLTNAVMHNKERGSVYIMLERNKLEIRNTGEEEALDSRLIFTRFYKKSQGRQSSGLGLALVKAIALRYGLSLDYSYRDKLHIITVLFPSG